MEDTLGEKELEILDLYLSLNPCFNGRYSRRNIAYNGRLWELRS